MIRVYTSLDSELIDIIASEIEKCGKRLWIMVYVLSLPYILREIVRLHKAGRDVRIILSNDPLNVEAVKFLEASGVQVKIWRQTYGILHTKLVILDDVVIITSANMTHYGLNRNQELMLIIKHGHTLRALENLFLAYWRSG
jgi:phosphatidylserine/phosphatidylglycerophosphate/cardiolipin synthase-like enzyme